jgi:SAM-dependent methyltransferase
MRETYLCPHCRGSLRYQAQAQVLTRLFTKRGASCLEELAGEQEFKALRIYEPGTLGPFRRLFTNLPGYHTSSYWPDCPQGEYRDGMRCENLMNLTYDDQTFDLVVTSDIFEHVRKAFDGFAEVGRVLRPGGVHVFSIPSQHPLPARSVERVDTTRPEDVHLKEPVYHNGHLVYSDFGRDLLPRLQEMGLPTEAVRFDAPEPGLEGLITFVSMREGKPGTSSTAR